MNDCLYAKSQDDVIRILELLNDTIPFNAASLVRKEHGSNIMRVDETISHNYPLAWVQSYYDYNFDRIDPVARLGVKTEKPFKWETAYHNVEMTSEMKEFIDMAEDFGMRSGIACTQNASIGESNDTFMSLETDGHKVSKEYLAIISYILPHLHEAMNKINKVAQIPKDIPTFTVREKETLKWSYEGKTAWEIGVILSISERTVKFHLNNIYQKLNVTNRSQAVAKAIRCGVV